MFDLLVREYGEGPHSVIALHGGPAAAGNVGPLARELGKRWHVFEPFQRGNGTRALTVAIHIQDLNELIREIGGNVPVLIGHSWGAMLALAYAAEQPTTVAGLVLIGCGTFSGAARAEYATRLEARMTATDRAAIALLEATEPDANRRGVAVGRVHARACGYDMEDDSDVVAFDASAHDQTWADMMRLQTEGVYPAAFAAISVPVLMLHGEADPHPGRSIREDLSRHIPHVEYQELPRCGHSPWLERQARTAFFEALASWLGARFREAYHKAG